LGVYGIGSLKRNAAGDRPASGVALAHSWRRWRRAKSPHCHGHSAAEAEIVEDADGKPRKLSTGTAARCGEPVGDLVVPLPPECRRWKPADKARRPDFQVVAANIGTRDPINPGFPEDASYPVDYFSDQKAKVFRILRA